MEHFFSELVLSHLIYLLQCCKLQDLSHFLWVVSQLLHSSYCCHFPFRSECLRILFSLWLTYSSTLWMSLSGLLSHCCSRGASFGYPRQSDHVVWSILWVKVKFALVFKPEKLILKTQEACNLAILLASGHRTVTSQAILIFEIYYLTEI